MKYWGFNDTPPNHEKYMGYATSIGATVARMPLWWDQPTNSPAQDRMVAWLRLKGIRSILHLSGQWVVDPAAYGGFMAQAAARFPHSVMEAWNEPNFPGFGDYKPEQAAALNDAAALAAPGRVLGSALAPWSGADGPDPDVYFGYQDEMYAAMKHRDKLLGASIHVYPPWYEPSWQFERAIERTFRTTGLKVWVTEWNLAGTVYTGVSSTQPKQAPTAARLVTQMDKDPRCEAAIWHALGAGTPPDANEVAGKIYATQLPELTYALWGAFKAAARS